MSSSPASFGQEQLWLVEQVAPGTSVNNTVVAWELTGPLDLGALQASLDLLVTRHGTLRTTLHRADGVLLQRLDPPRPVELAVVDLAAAAGAAWSDIPLGPVREHLRRPFDLTADLMMRPVLGRIDAQRHLLVLIVHHAASDGWSSGVLRDDLAAAYPVFAAGGTPELPDAGPGYARFAERERALAARRPADEWLDGLRTKGKARDPLFGRRRPLVGEAGTERAHVPPAVAQVLGDAADAAGATMTMAVTALLAVVLGRWTARTEVRFSAPVSTRTDPESDRMVGYCVNPVPLTLDLTDNPRFAEAVNRVRDAMVTAIDHAHVPPAAIQAAIAGGSTEISATLLGATIGVGVVGSPRFAMGALTAVDRFVPGWHTMFGLSLRADAGPAGIDVVLEHNTDLLDTAAARRMLEHVLEVARAVTVDRRVLDLPPAPAADLARTTAWGSGTPARDVPDLIEAIRARVDADRDADAVLAADATLTYGGLWSASGAVAARLRAAGVGPEDLVAVCMPRSAAFVVAVLGVLRAGGAFLPVDPRDPDARRAGLLDRAGPVAVLADEPDRAAGWPGLVLTVPLPDEATAAEVVVPVSPDGMAYVIHTSGSTGRPKGVVVTRSGISNYLHWAVAAYGIAPGTTVPLHTSPAFDLALTSLLGPLTAGAAVHVLPEAHGPLAAADGRVAHQVVKSTPSHLAELVDRTTTHPAMWVAGGERLPVSLARRWLRKAPGTALVNEYGPTETVVGSTALVVTEAVAAELPDGDPVPVGGPIQGTTVHVLDPDLRPVPIGVPGELCIGGAGVARGYLGAPGVTADRFVPDPVTGARLYRTGDLARWAPDGALHVLGRMDDQLKILGFRIEPGEVEAALAAAPGVARAAVVADRRDPDRVRLVGFVQATPGTDGAGLGPGARDWLRSRLPAHLVPERIVPVQRIPLDANGKLDRHALPLPDGTEQAPDPVVTSTAGTDPSVHDLVRGAWCEVLGVGAVPDDVDFFTAGGTSLHLMQVESALRDRGVRSLTVADLFRFLTVDELADRITAAVEVTR